MYNNNKKLNWKILQWFKLLFFKEFIQVPTSILDRIWVKNMGGQYTCLGGQHFSKINVTMITVWFALTAYF